MLVIRAMMRNDVDAVKALEMATAEAPHWTWAVYEEFLSEENAGKRLFVAEVAGKLAGFVAARIVVDTCELESIVVDSLVRRSGVGRALLAALMEWAREHQTARLELEVRRRNHSAIAFYEHIGFTSDGTRPGYYQGPQDDALLMSLALV